jgi:hypothetical protein
VKPTRLTQPYRLGSINRHPGAALTAMTKGRTLSGFNPQDIRRAAFLMGAGKQASRMKRPPRTPRPVRPAR